MNEWKDQAEALFFIDHLDITEIAAIVHRARETVSRYINDCAGYESEIAMRKQRSVVERKEYQKQWDRENRSNRYSHISRYTLKSEHEIAVMILSRERFFKDG